MADFIFTLEKYHGTKSRHTCPNCSARREFVRYIDANGNYLADNVRKCNRETNCGYHKKPKEFFSENPNFPKLQQFQSIKKRKLEKLDTIKKARNAFDVIDFDFFARTLGNYNQNAFIQFLSDLFRNNREAVQTVLQKYPIGTYKDGLTVFWQIDQNGKIRTGKIMRYDMQTGKRQIVRTWIENGETHELKTDWIHTKIKKDFKLKQCYFGEHLLKKESGKTIAIVEAEKTALICAIRFPEMLWLAIGAKGYLTDERLQIFRDRKIILFPDADAYSDWKEKANRAKGNGFNVRISDLIETRSTDVEKQKGFDLADYLISEIRKKTEAKTAYESLIKSPFFTGWTNASLF
jgi:hypothetical protein